MLEDKSVCIDDFFQYLGNRLSVDSNRAESDPLSKPDTGQNLQTLQSMQKTQAVSDFQSTFRVVLPAAAVP
jgi:hypothetical protein